MASNERRSVMPMLPTAFLMSSTSSRMKASVFQAAAIFIGRWFVAREENAE